MGSVVLAAAEAGHGGSGLLLLHGFTGAKEDFADWIDAFAAHGFHVVAPDNRGHGASGQPTDESAYSLATSPTTPDGLADALGWDRFALLGHSMGGMIAQILALAAPERLTALVLMDTTYTRGRGDRSRPRRARRRGGPDRGLDRLLELMNEHDSPLATEADATGAGRA